MKKQLSLFLLLIATGIQLQAQDLIIPASGEKIACRIQQIRNDSIYYEVNRSGMILMRSLSLTEVREYRRGYFAQDTVRSKMMMVDEAPQYRFALLGGMTYMAGAIAAGMPPAMADYVRNLRPGWLVGLTGSYTLSADYGVGLKYVYSNNTHSVENMTVTIDGKSYAGAFQDAIQIHYIGPTAVYRNATTLKGVAFYSDFTVGYTHYTNDAISLSQHLTLNGQALGLHARSGFDWRITERMGIGFSAAYFISWLSKYTYGTGSSKQTLNLPEGSYENLSRVEVSAGLRFY